MTCGSRHLLDPKTGAPLTREGWLEDGYGAPYRPDQVTIRELPPVTVIKSIAKNYLQGWLGIHVHGERLSVSRSQAEHLCAIFRRLQRPPDCFNTGVGTECAKAVAHLVQDGNGGREQPVLVAVVDVVEHGERVPLGVPSVVRVERLQLPDLGDPTWVDALQTPTHGTCPILRSLDDWEGVLVSRGSTIGEDKLPDDVVEGGAEVIQHVSVDNGESTQVHLPLCPPPEDVPTVALQLVGNDIRLTLDGLLAGGAESVSVYARPVELLPYAH